MAAGSSGHATLTIGQVAEAHGDRHLGTALRSCIGCGCLSLQRCNLYNKEDRLSTRGPGARLLNVGIPGEA